MEEDGRDELLTLQLLFQLSIFYDTNICKRELAMCLATGEPDQQGMVTKISLASESLQVPVY